MRSSPFQTSTCDTAASTDISEFAVGLLDEQWRAVHAVHDDDLAKKLCETLKTILGEAPLTERSKHSLLPFLPTLLMEADGMVNEMWLENPSESHVSEILVPREFKLSLWDRARGY